SIRNRYDQGEDYQYDSSDHLTSVSLQNGASSLGTVYMDRAAIDGQNVITRIHDYALRTLNYEYAETGGGGPILTKVTGGCECNGNAPATEYRYDDRLQLTKILDAYANERQIDYSAGFVTKQTLSNSAVLEYRYAGSTSATVIDPVRTTYNYDFV